MAKIKKTVLGVEAPQKAYDPVNYDKKCPFTGEITVKKELLRGKVIKKDTNKSATIEWLSHFYVPKYERFEMRRSRLRVHNPPSVNADVGQEVLVARTRPLSKTKHHVILKIIDEKKRLALVDPIKMEIVEETAGEEAFPTPKKEKKATSPPAVGK
ncbi:30S ribosomal protein S17 [Candidatus Woesearchaeota archaeon]|nr:30S ribosomal protein S17 [Candidatus Woesearchaeota archaeon]